MTQTSIKRPKELIKRSNKSIKRSKKSKNNLKKQYSSFFIFFDQIPANPISFLFLLINFELFNGFLSCWNQFCHDDLDFNDDFGAKMLIKWQFESNFKRNLAQRRSNRISLQCCSQAIIR